MRGFTIIGSVIMENEELRVGIDVLVRVKKAGGLLELLGGFEREARRLGVDRLVIEGSFAKEVYYNSNAVDIFDKLGYSFPSSRGRSLVKTLPEVHD